MRPHDPSLCDRLVVDVHMEWGAAVVRSGELETVADVEADDGGAAFSEDTNPGHTLVGPLLGKPRRPAR